MLGLLFIDVCEKDSRMNLNFVLSNNMHSHIFDAIAQYFKRYLPPSIKLTLSTKPTPKMDVYHYHRPHLEARLKRNSVVTVHHDLEDTSPWLEKQLFLNKYQEAKIIICLNSSQKKQLDMLGFEQTIIIPHGVNKTVLKPKKKIESAKLILGVVSKRYQRRVKGEAYLFELYKRLNPKLLQFCFIGKNRHIDAKMAGFFGFDCLVYDTLPYSLFNSLYQYIDILFIPSLYEGGPASVPEALYTRTPILGRRIGMIGDLVIEGENGYFLTGQVEKDVALIHAIAQNENKKLERLMKAIQEKAVELLGWEEVVREHVTCYKKIMEK
jgi:glycosyltransferase involved in cell wall biosynthesis